MTIVPKVRPRYIAVIEERVYVEHEPEQPRMTLRPDVTVATDAGTARAAWSTQAGSPFKIPIRMPDAVTEM